MKIHISQPTKTLLETFREYETELRGEMEIKVEFCPYYMNLSLPSFLNLLPQTKAIEMMVYTAKYVHVRCVMRLHVDDETCCMQEV